MTSNERLDTPAHGLSRRRLLGTGAAAAGAAILTSRGLPAAAQDKVELVFTY